MLLLTPRLPRANDFDLAGVHVEGEEVVEVVFASLVAAEDEQLAQSLSGRTIFISLTIMSVILNAVVALTG